MNAFKLNLRYHVLLSSLLVLFSSLSIQASIFEKEKTIQEMLEDLNPSVSFSFSKNILDFFDADLDWKDTKKHLEGDFSKAGFFAFDETTAKKSLSSLLKHKGYFHIRIDDKDKNNDKVELFVNQKGNEVEEAHFIIESDEKLIVFSLYGKMRLKEQK